MEIEITVAAVLLFLLAFLATVDMAFVQLSDLSLRRLTSETEENERVNTEFLREILENRPRFRFALSAAMQVLLIIFTILTTLIAFRFFPQETHRAEVFFAALCVSLVLSVLFRQFIPRLITGRNPERMAVILLPVVHPFYSIFGALADPFGNLRREKSATEITAVPHLPEEETDNEENETDSLQTLIEAGEAEGMIEERERELIETIVDFGDTTSDEVMTPRTEIEALPLEATVREARDAIIESKYSRLPVYREQIDNIEGVIYVRDLLQFWAEDKEDITIENSPNLIRPVKFVPETKPVAELLKEMQTARVQMAIIVDEYGGVAGLVTVEDILEELVGEIEDEDTEQEEIIEIVEGENKAYFDVLGSVEIGKIERLFDMEIEDDDFTTIAGLVISELGYVPKEGEKFQFRGLDVEILRADEKRINLLRLRRAPENTNEEDNGQFE
ncbi:MAG: hemolysin family protein [Acidobacteriota bacterium]|nr:hemolysin family protein [Acidobacteriota bacterium]